MVGKAQQVDDPGSKHHRNDVVRMEDATVTRNIILVVLAIAVFVFLLDLLGGSNLMH